MKELTEHKINELKSCASIKALIQGRELTVHQRGDAQQELDRLLSVLDAFLSKDQPVAGADDEHLFYVEYWAGRLLGNEQDWEIAKEIIDSQKLYASAVASKIAREAISDLEYETLKRPDDLVGFKLGAEWAISELKNELK